MSTIPGLKEVLEAAQTIRPFVHRTPVISCDAVNRRAGARVHFKCENLQKVGAFKFRGACNALFSLGELESSRGVIAHSSGNHAQALALAARMRGIPAYIVMPNNAPTVKKAAVEEYGANITFCEPNLAARESTQARIIASTGAVEIHPYDNDKVIAGQGTAALEFMDEVPDLDFLIAPVGGGGLLAGTAIAAERSTKKIRVIGAEPLNANDAFLSLAAGRIIPSENPKTIADGLLTSLGSRNFLILQRHLECIFTVDEAAIITAMRFFWERAKVIIEPSAATALAVLFANRDHFLGKNVGIILSGGNVDLMNLPWQDQAYFTQSRGHSTYGSASLT